MRVCVFNAKGGVGRTTLSLNLASWFAKRDPQSRVLLADCDPQGSALAWAELVEETEFTIGRSRSRGFDVEILDMGPSFPANGVLPQASLYLVPTMLDGVSHVVFLRTLGLLQEHGKPFLVVANRVNNRAEHRDRLECEELRGAVQVRDRAAIAASYAESRTVFDMRGPHVADAQKEIEQLAQAMVRVGGNA